MRWTDFQAVLFDLDGTLCHQRQPLPGAADAVASAQAAGLPVIVVTNNAAHTPEHTRQRLKDCGIPQPERIHTACHALAELARRMGRDLGRPPRLFNFAGEALPRELGESAVFVQAPDEPCDAVAVSTFWRENQKPFDLDRAIVGMSLLRQGARLLAGCADRIFPVADHPAGIDFGTGSIAAMFTYAANLAPGRVHYAGKPEPAFFETLAELTGLRLPECLIIGDNLESDIQGGQSVGMSTLLVCTGVSTRADAMARSQPPETVFDDLPSAVAALEDAPKT